ncbi:coiled-coil domain-containing protein 80 [Episyrphus balteatus]|uniref:coiled-coil domain-containing protein 80 n=1 Tax=Episyrphus balteatus TaxID=286459 RepID=UPI0024861B45|nr:coiled-coil domain-containing protein 80 [Episyrphus balteatus]
MRRTIWIAFLLWVCSITFCDASWGTPGTGQYHIQTDEGPERFFRFQTDNGQYRKEKRLQDGTVIGTDAWIDAAGYLRQKDYIADSKGYRILKSKTVYVGHGRPIEEAIRSIKGVAAQSGVLVDPALSYGSNHYAPTPRTTPKPSYLYPTTTSTTTTTTTTTTPAPPTQGYLTPSEAALIPPSPYLGYDHYPQPEVFIRPNSQPVESNIVPETYYLLGSSSTERTPSIPSDTFLPPYENSRRVRPIGAVSSTPSPNSDNEAIEYSHSSTENYPSGYSYSSPRPFSPSSTESPEGVSSSSQAPISSNDYDDPYGFNSYSSSTTERPSTEYTTPYADLLPPTRRRRPAYGTRIQPPVYNNNLGSGYEDQYSQYDGVSVTKNGFRYYLPQQYHEEEQVAPQKRAGSFGYIDPFGIRRVIYYNASPENGFVHRKNNRYVGFHSTPYDPRP